MYIKIIIIVMIILTVKNILMMIIVMVMSHDKNDNSFDKNEDDGNIHDMAYRY